jgi:ABC-type transport system substrate-binding protein
MTNLNSAGAAQAALALSWNEQDNDKSWDFRLRPDVQFQDGSPLTADAALTSLKASCLPEEDAGGGGTGVLPACPWSSVHAAGPGDLIITTDHPEPDLPELLAQPQFAISEKNVAGTTIGTGPFQVASISHGVLTLIADGSSWEGRPYLDSVEIVQHRSIRDQWMDLSVGRADLVQVPPELLPEAEDGHLNLLVSQPVDLLAMTISPRGELSQANIRQGAVLAVDREALHNVIFQKQGEISASLLPEWLSGYSFLFSTTRDLTKARTLHGEVTTGQRSMASDSDGSIMQLAASRLALNLGEAGFNVRMAAPGTRAAFELREVHLNETDPRAALDAMLDAFGENVTVTGANSEAFWKAEQKALQDFTVVPLLWLPRAWAYGGQIRDLKLSSDGEPTLANASLEGGK